MGLTAGTPLREIKVDTVFLGSCTNGRIEDLRVAAELLRGKHIDPDTRMLVVPGSVAVKAQAEAEGLDRVFLDAGAEWRGAGCSMCLGMNPDQLKPGERSASTSNRNFQGRQGKGGRTHLVSPAVAAATALTGKLTAPADLEGHGDRSRWTPSPRTPAPPPRCAAANVDTDQIIPAEYLKRITRTGFEDGLFEAWRTNEPDFVLNQPQYAGASILVAGPDFGTGSSREHAVLGAAGRRLPGGHQLPVRRHLPQQLDQVRAAHGRCCRRPTSRRCGRRSRPTRRPQVTVDLQAQQVTLRRRDRAVPDRRVHPLAAARGARRRRPHRAATWPTSRRSRRSPPGVPPEGAARPLSGPARPGRGRGRGSSPRAAPRAGRRAPRRCPWPTAGSCRVLVRTRTPSSISTDGIAPPWLQTTVTPGLGRAGPAAARPAARPASGSSANSSSPSSGSRPDAAVRAARPAGRPSAGSARGAAEQHLVGPEERAAPRRAAAPARGRARPGAAGRRGRPTPSGRRRRACRTSSSVGISGTSVRARSASTAPVVLVRAQLRRPRPAAASAARRPRALGSNVAADAPASPSSRPA